MGVFLKIITIVPVIVDAITSVVGLCRKGKVVAKVGEVKESVEGLVAEGKSTEERYERVLELFEDAKSLAVVAPAIFAEIKEVKDKVEEEFVNAK